MAAVYFKKTKLYVWSEGFELRTLRVYPYVLQARACGDNYIYPPCTNHQLQKQNTLARLCDPACRMLHFENGGGGGRSSPRSSKGIDARGWLLPTFDWDRHVQVRWLMIL